MRTAPSHLPRPGALAVLEAPGHAASHETTPRRRSEGWLTVALLLLVAGLVVLMAHIGGGVAPILGITLMLGMATPAALAGFRPRREVVVRIAVILAVLPAGLLALLFANGDGNARYRNHDGGVYVTRAAAQQMLHGENPYTADFRDDLPRSWDLVQAADGAKVPNPVVEHFPYLPAAGLVHVPFVAAADLLGLPYDPRLLGWGVLLAAALVITRRPEPPWARAATLMALGNGFMVLCLAWGTNDAQVAALVVLACLLGARYPRSAASLLAVAVSCKFLVLVVVPPLAYCVLRRGGLAGLRRWWPMPALLAGTVVPYLLASPASLVEDAVAFNLGLTALRMPASGIGLPLMAPGVFHGPVLAAATLAGAILAVASPMAIVRRVPSLVAAAPASAVGLWFLLWPARTFQTTYLTLLLCCLAPAWLLLGDDRSTGPASSSQPEQQPAGAAFSRPAPADR